MNGDITIVYLECMSAQRVEYQLSGHSDDICSLSFASTKGHYEEGVLASVSRDGFVKVWDIVRTNNIADIKLDAHKSQAKNWFALSFIPNNNSNEKFQILIGCGNGDILSIEVPTKPPDSKIRIYKPMNYLKNKHLSHSNVIFSIAIDFKTMIAITSSLDHQIIGWDLIERKPIEVFITFSHGVHQISLSPIDPSRVAVAVGDGVHLIKFDENLKVVEQKRIQISRSKDSKCLAIVWHPECENRLAFGTSSGDITVMDMNSTSKYPKYRKTMSSSKIYGLQWGPSLEDSDESTLYSVHSNGKLCLHYISNNFIQPFNHYIEDEIKRTEIMWKTNYKHLSVGNDSGTVDIFEHKFHKLIPKLRIEAFQRPVLSLRWNSIKDEETSNWLAISSYDGQIKCYSLHNFLSDENSIDESPVQTISSANRVLKGHSDRITSMSWCPFDSNKLVSVSYDRSAIVWHVLNESPLLKFSGHRGILYCVVWSLTDPDLILSGGEDNYFHMWRPSQQNTCANSENLSLKCDNWPHLEVEETETSVSNVLKDCINEVVLRENPEQNGFIAEEEIRRQRIMKTKNKSTKSKTKFNKELKYISLLPLSNSIEKSSTKYQKIEDIEALFEKMKGNQISEDMSERLLLYGNSDDMKKFVANEVLNHLKHENKEQKDILSLLVDIKATIEESIEQKDTNSYLTSLSMCVSKHHWNQSMILLAKQLSETETELQNYRMYRTEMSSILLLSQNRNKEAIDLLVSNLLFREALIVCKVRMNSYELCEYVYNEWAQNRKQNNDIEGAAKCYIAVNKFVEAADLLSSKNDQQFDHTISLFRLFIKQN